MEDGTEEERNAEKGESGGNTLTPMGKPGKGEKEGSRSGSQWVGDGCGEDILMGYHRANKPAARLQMGLPLSLNPWRPPRYKGTN